MRHVVKSFGRAGLWCLTLLFVAGVAMRLTIKDEMAPTLLLFYGTPPAVLAGLAVVCAAGWYVQGKRRLAVCLLIAAVVCGVWWSQVAFVQNHVDPSPSGLRALFWNPARQILGREGVFAEIRRHDADLIGIVEAGAETSLDVLLWRQEFSDYQMTDAFGDMIVLCRGEILSVRFRRLADLGLCKQVDVRVGEDRLTVLLVDIWAAPFRSRLATLDQLVKIVDELADRPLLILGDFNLPGDSQHFDGLRQRCQNAFEHAGNGLVATWPVPLPVLQLDHAWANQHVELSSCQYGWSWYSDHRPVLLHVQIDSPDPDRGGE